MRVPCRFPASHRRPGFAFTSAGGSARLRARGAARRRMGAASPTGCIVARTQRGFRNGLLVAGLVAAAGSTTPAHVGTSNAYFDGAAGPYQVRVIVRTPGVIPGLAQASVRILGGEGVERVTVRPLRSDVGIEGAPPPDVAGPVPGERGLYSAELWLMTAGSYSVEVGVAGTEGQGTVFVPVLAVAERRLAMDPAFSVGLAAAGLFLFVGAVTIVGAAVRECVLEPGTEPDARGRWKGRFAMAGFTIVLGAFVVGGRIWWDAVDAAYRSRMYRPWNTTAEVSATGGTRLLTLAIDDADWRAIEGLPDAGLLPDHGKLMHMFLVRRDDMSAFAHVHPVREGRDRFTVALPPLPAGEYRIYADIVLGNGFAPTLVNTAHVPLPGSAAGGQSQVTGDSRAAGESRTAGTRLQPVDPAPDPDDSWAALVPHGVSRSADYALPSGRTVRWERGGPLDVDEETTLRFSVSEPDGSPSVLEPYMGMLGHAAVLRDDGSVFVHLHPAGSINLTAQMRFAAAEGALAGAGPVSGDAQDAIAPDDVRAGMMPAETHEGRVHAAQRPTNQVTFPFVFPEPGDYRIVVQVKVGAAVETAAFDVEAGESSPS